MQKLDYTRLANIVHRHLKLDNLSCAFENLKFNINLKRDTKELVDDSILGSICSEYFGENDKSYRHKMRLYQCFRVCKKFEKIFRSLDCSKQSKNENLKFEKHLTKIVWETLLNKYCIKYRDDRLTLKKPEISELISTIIQGNNIKCFVKCDFNWFIKDNSNRKNAPFWHAKFKCINSNCKNQFILNIYDHIPARDGGRDINFECIIINEHSEFVRKPVSCRAIDRKKVAERLKNTSPIIISNENALLNLARKKSLTFYSFEFFYFR